MTIDRYGRTVAKLRVDGRDVGRELVATGNAWVYRGAARDTCKNFRFVWRAGGKGKSGPRMYTLSDSQGAPPRL